MYGTQTNPLNIPTATAFENDVNMYGTQTGLFVMYVANPFENDVNMHGTQTILEFCLVIFRFENDVKYLKQWKLQNSCTANNQKVLSELRMM